jgi:septation ring formation regulator EzrA
MASKTALSEAYRKLEDDEREAVKKLWRLQKQIQDQERELQRRNIFRQR